MPIYTDVHCHLNHAYFNDKLDQVIENARKAGVKKIITAGVNPATNREVLELAKKYDIVECSLGAYPYDALNIKVDAIDEIGLSRTDNFDLDKELDFIEKNKNQILGIGEVGLDFKYLKEHQEKQKENFQKCIDLAEKINKPLIVHSRSAEKDVIEMLESSKLKKIVLHCFGGNKKLIQRATDNKYTFSIPTVITRLQHFQHLVKMVNINQLLTETDAPWLSPVANTKNEPANVIESVRMIAEIKKFEVEDTANSIYMNYQRLFE